MTLFLSDQRHIAKMGSCGICLLAALFLLSLGGTGWTAQGGGAKKAATAFPGQDKAEASPKPIEITADRLISDSQNHWARFEGQVKAIQGDTTIEADHLTIHYKSGGEAQASAGTDALSKITASGNVRIKFDNRLAVTDEAVYITGQRILTLTGSPARVTSDKDLVSGTVIIFYRDSGRIEVQGGDGKQVEAIFHSGEKGLE
jgi:lipopolysaccharide export system protein LptA